MSTINTPCAAVVISTKDRKTELCGALESVFSQSIALEVLVMDDGSTDGTADMVCKKFPRAALYRSESSLGYVAQRNRGARLATAPIVFSIDDDAAFSTPLVVEQTLSDFADPRVGAVAIPYIEPHKADRLLQSAPSRDQIWVTDTFIGTAHAVRRDLFLELGGYRDTLIHQGEERDFCIRMLDSGRVVRLGNSDAIIHYESPRRDFRRMDFFGRRNDVLFVWHNVPLPSLPLHLAATTINGMRSAFVARRFYKMTAGIVAGYLECLRRWSERSPVSNRAYILNRRLKKRGPVSLSNIAELIQLVAKPSEFA